jgi:hypothetical protein
MIFFGFSLKVVNRWRSGNIGEGKYEEIYYLKIEFKIVIKKIK